MRNFKKHKINDANHYKHLTPDTDCTCDVGINGPAGDPDLIAKGSGGYDHPQTPPAKGPGADPELLAKSKPPLKHPETPAATGPAAE